MLNFLILMIMVQSATIHQMPVLPFGYADLAPQISEETMEYHYGKHLRTYINNLNDLILGTKFENASLEDIVIYSDGAIYSNGAQAWNHTFLFQTFSPNPKAIPTGILGEAINHDFNSFENFKDQFIKAGVSLFGSGWVWLAKDKHDRLMILPMSNAGNPLREGLKPLMCLDVWEHAYYIDYRNRRADALKAHWERIDWRVVEDRFR